jgi:hypothetical protein
MCKHCDNAYSLRPTPLDDNELALLRRLKEINDTAKLAARMPAWIKTHNRLCAPPKPFVFKPNQPPVYPSWTNRPTTVTWVDADMGIPSGGQSMAKYILAFEKMNCLKAA